MGYRAVNCMCCTVKHVMSNHTVLKDNYVPQRVIFLHQTCNKRPPVRHDQDQGLEQTYHKVLEKTQPLDFWVSAAITQEPFNWSESDFHHIMYRYPRVHWNRINLPICLVHLFGTIHEYMVIPVDERPVRHFSKSFIAFDCSSSTSTARCYNVSSSHLLWPYSLIDLSLVILVVYILFPHSELIA